MRKTLFENGGYALEDIWRSLENLKKRSNLNLFLVFMIGFAVLAVVAAVVIIKCRKGCFREDDDFFDYDDFEDDFFDDDEDEDDDEDGEDSDDGGKTDKTE